MSGTHIGGLKAAKTNKEKRGEDFYRDIGRKGGQNGHTGGFAANPELAKIAGSKGGKISKRGKAKAPRKDKGVKRGPRKEKGGWKWLFSRGEK